MIEWLAGQLLDRGWSLVTAESCTGGLIGSELTNLSGSSEWYLGGVIAYSNALKTSLLGVDEATLAEHGAVSRETVLAMAAGAASRLGAQCAVAVSGIAGPTGGTEEKPVGTVWVAWVTPDTRDAEQFLFDGDRIDIKRQSALAAIAGFSSRMD
ncbi:MAG: CinA family protein [Acidobacteriota bacterium]